MGLFNRSFYKEGPGVSPDEPQKRSFFRFFSIFSRKIWHFVKANLIYCIALIPTFIVTVILMNYIMSSAVISVFPQIGAEDEFGTMLLALFMTLIASLFYVSIMGGGPATAGITYIMRNFAREEHAWLWSDFKDSVKNNFKQSLIVFVIDIAVIFVVFIATSLYRQIGGTVGLLRYFLYVLAFIYMLMHMYIYPIMITFELPLKDIYRNALIFTVGKLPSNIFVFIVLFAIHILIPVLIVLFGGKYFMLFLIIFVLLEVFVLQIFSSFLVNFNVYPKMKKYMLDRAEEETSAE